MTVKQLDPITFILENDSRLAHQSSTKVATRREYAHERLPHSGIAHPFVKAILAQYLGSLTDKMTLESGLAVLRGWWQHRRKGENKTSVKTLRTGKMQRVVDNHTRNYFELAYSLVMDDKEAAPRTLKKKMEALGKRCQTLAKEGGSNVSSLMPMHSHSARAQRSIVPSPLSSKTVSYSKGKSISKSIYLPDVTEDVNCKVAVSADREISGDKQDNNRKTPLVFVSANGDCQILLHIDGITCAHCVKIVEAVLKGCNGESGIAGLLDAAGDRETNSVFVKIDNPSSASRIAFEAKQNLALVGYSAQAKEVEVYNGCDLSIFSAPSHQPIDFLDWDVGCTCPDSGVFPMNCGRHSQMEPCFSGKLWAREQEIAALLQEPMSAAAVGNDNHEPFPIPVYGGATGIFTLEDEQMHALLEDLEPLDPAMDPSALKLSAV